MSVPEVSVVIPSFNRANLVAEALDSVRAQSHGQWEALVVDDGSTDESLAVFEEAAREDGRIHLHCRQRSPKGASTCRNIGLEKARGKYVVFLDSDDLLAPWCLRGRLSVVGSRPELGFAVFPTLQFRSRMGDEDRLAGVATSEDTLLRFLRLDFPWCVVGPIWRRSALEQLGGFDETAPNLEDWELHVRALAERMRFEVQDCLPDSFYRAHPGPRLSQVLTPSVISARLRMMRRVVAILEDRGRFGAEERNALFETFVHHTMERAAWANDRALGEESVEIARRVLRHRALPAVRAYLRLIEAGAFKPNGLRHRLARRALRVAIYASPRPWRGTFCSVRLPPARMRAVRSQLAAGKM